MTVVRILKERTAALIIDIQEHQYPFIFENEKLTKNVTTLIEGLKIIGVPIFGNGAVLGDVNSRKMIPD